MRWGGFSVVAYRLERCDIAFATRNVVYYETTSGLASVLVIEEVAEYY